MFRKNEQPSNNQIGGQMNLGLKNKTSRFLLIVLLSTLVSIILHQIHNDPLMDLDSKAQSIVITSGLFPIVASIALATTFGIIGLIFLWIQKHLWGSKLQKGLIFGLSMCGVWIIGMTEAHVLFSLSLFGELYTGFADGVGILLMSVLLGKYFVDDTFKEKKKPQISVMAILSIAIFYLIARYFSYFILNIESAAISAPFATFVWTAALGIWIGFMYTLMDIDKYRTTPFKHAVLFGGIVFGIEWIIFNLFALIFIVTPVSDLIYRSLFDVLGVMIGVYVFSKFVSGHDNKRQSLE